MITFVTANHFNELRIFNTLCHSIAKRRIASVDVAKKSDRMFVIGGRMSSNTKRLFEACKSVNLNTYHIETKDDIQPQWFANVETIGVTAGASTPQWIIEDIVNFIKNM
jgi:4-hydroxy-3-methylbut-2-enyl diphosphate reductase